MIHEPGLAGDYESPELRDLGPIAELTQKCFKWPGGSDGLFFVDIVGKVCVSR